MTLPAVRGHERLRAALRATRAQTLLFVGPEGVGRRTVARWYAALLNCAAATPGAPGAEPCGRCDSCRRFALGDHPDHREVAPRATTARGRARRRPELVIDQLVPRPRGEPEPLSRWLEARPAYRWRVGVIDHAETLNASAGNAFLKMLEEPPSWAVIVLVAPSPQAVLPTIASRAVALRFGAVDTSAYPDLGDHPAHRLGRVGELELARRDPAGYEALRDAARAYAAALPGTLEEALEASDALEKAWSNAGAAGDDDTDASGSAGRLGDELRERLRALPAPLYAAALEELDRCEEALGAYATPSLAVHVLTLELRALLRRGGIRELGPRGG